MMFVAGWKPERLAGGFAGADRAAVALVALDARWAVAVESVGLTGRGGLKAGPLRRAAGAALGGIVLVSVRDGVVISSSGAY